MVAETVSRPERRWKYDSVIVQPVMPLRSSAIVRRTTAPLLLTRCRPPSA
nr:hypothetical protein [Nonomuraea zeae]